MSSVLQGFREFALGQINRDGYFFWLRKGVTKIPFD